MSKKDIAILVFEALNTKNFDILKGKFNENSVFNFPGVKEIETEKKILIFLKALMRKYKFLEFSIKDIIQENDKIVVVWTNKGEKTNNQKYENSGMTLFHFSSEKISFISDYFKDTSFTN